MTRRGAGGQCQHRADYCVGDPIVRYCVGEQSVPRRGSGWVNVDEHAPLLTPPTRYRVVVPTSYHVGDLMTRRGAGGQCQHRADYCVGDPIVRYWVREQSVPPRGSGWVSVSTEHAHHRLTHPLPRGGTDLIPRGGHKSVDRYVWRRFGWSRDS